jgi:anti-sigma B factor antagonist
MDFVTSAGLRVLLRSSKLLQGAGGKMKLCGANDLVGDVLKTAGFDSLLNLYSTESEAIQSF